MRNIYVKLMQTAITAMRLQRVRAWHSTYLTSTAHCTAYAVDYIGAVLIAGLYYILALSG